jgi:uncharacterized protein YeaO (DUF488 family)
MALRVVRLGSPRQPEEGLRLGTVRPLPRGVPKAEYARRDWFDLWYPNLAPGLVTMKLAKAAATPAQWSAFARKYRTEMATPDNRHSLELLAALSQRTNLSVGCYCEDESRCHRSILRALLAERGARLA